MQQISSVNKNQLINGYFIKYSPELSKVIGRNQAIFLDHLFYWFDKTTAGTMIDGERYVYNTLEQWVVNIDFTVKTLQRTITKLKQLKLIDVVQLDQGNRINYYKINYKNLSELMPEKQQDKMSSPTGQNDLLYTKTTQIIPDPENPKNSNQKITTPNNKYISRPSGEGDDFKDDIEKMEQDWPDPAHAEQVKAESQLLKTLKAACGHAINIGHELIETDKVIQGWIDDLGASLDDVIIPTLKTACKYRKSRQISSWAYFTKAIQNALLSKPEDDREGGKARDQGFELYQPIALAKRPPTQPTRWEIMTLKMMDEGRL